MNSEQKNAPRPGFVPLTVYRLLGLPPSVMVSNLVSRVAGNIKDIVKTGDRLVIGLSGGVDSVVLLDILSRLARRRRFRLAALHVNHQLSRNARQWAAFCRRLCRARGIALRAVKVTVPRGNSLEAAARAARYDAFRRVRADYVALAHNQDDQAETVLLQLLRGAGVKGLAAMPLVRKAEGGRRKAEGGKGSLHPSSFILHPSILRPLLDTTRADIEAYARARGLAWIEDESNAEPYFLRNFLRREVLPVIARRFSAYRGTLARSARNFAEAARLLEDLALADGAQHCRDGALEVAALRRLPRARAKNLLRWFLASRGALMPNSDRLEEAVRQACTAKDDARVCINLGGHELRRFAAALYVVPKRAAPGAGFARRWRGESVLAVPELGGVLTMLKRRGAGIDAAKLTARAVAIRLRQGGEQLQPDCNRPRRSLKNLLQEAAVPPWLRARLPLLFCGDALVWVPGIGIDCSFQAQPGQSSLLPHWRPVNSL